MQPSRQREARDGQQLGLSRNGSSQGMGILALQVTAGASALAPVGTSYFGEG